MKTWVVALFCVHISDETKLPEHQQSI